MFSGDISSICQNVYLSVCLSVFLSVCGQQVFCKCYDVVSVFMLLQLLNFRLLEHYVVIFYVLAAIAALQVTTSVSNEWYTAYIYL